MAIKEYNVDLDIKGRVLATTVPNSTGSIVTWNSTSKVFGLRTNAQIISDLNLSSNFITTNTTQTGLTGNKTSNGIWTLGQVRKAGQTDSSILLAGGGHRPVSDFALTSDIPSVTGFIPYTGANQSIDFNTQNLTTGGYTNRLHSYFERINLASDSVDAGNFKLLTNIAAAEIGNNSLTSDIIITLPITTTTAWQAEIDILREGYRTTLNVGGYTTTNISRFVNVVYGDIGDILEVKFGRIGDSTVLIIKRSNSTIRRLQVNISKFYYHHSSSATLYNSKTKYKVEYINESELVGFTLNGVVVNSDFKRDSYYLDYNNFTNTPTIPTVNNGQLTLSTGTGLSGSATFTANQSGNSTFSVSVASTHKLPTTAEWNALSTQTLGNSTSNLIVSNTVQRAALTGDVTASQNSNVTTIANNAVTHAKYQNIPTQRILGRGAAGTGNVQELTIGANLTLSTTGVLSATNTNTTYSAGIGLSLSGTTFGQTITTSGTGTYVKSITQTASGFQVNLGTPPNTNTTYTGSNGINVSGTVISPTYGTTAGTIAQGNDSRINNGQTAFGWGNHALAGYLTSTALNNYYQSGDVNIPALGGDYVVFPYKGNTANFNWNETTDPGFYKSTFNAGNASTYNAPKNGFYGYAENIHHSTSGNLTQYAHPYRVTDGKWMRSKYGDTWTDWVEFTHSGNLDSQATSLGFIKSVDLSGYVPTARTITAGNGLSGGGNLTANRTITLGTPSAITLSSTNSVTTSSHTHAFTPGGTTAQYIRGDGSLATLPTFTDAITSISRDGVNIPIVSQNVDIPIFSTTGAGLVPPRVGSVATKYLREDGTWVTPTNTTYSAGTLALLQAGTNTTNRIWSAKILADYVTSMTPSSILSYSSANGIIVTDWNSFALSEYAMSLGYGSVTSGNYATSVGGLLSTTGFGSTNQGYSNSITKPLGYSLGAYNSVRATLSGAFGIGLINRNDGAFIVGRYNAELPIEPYDTTSPHKQAVFAIGAGRDETDRFTALTVYGDGRADYAHGYNDSTWTNNTLVTKKWVLDNVGGSSGGGVGYRNVREQSIFDLSSEYSPSLAESVYHVMTERPVVFIGGSEVFHDGYKVTIMISDDITDISLDNTQAVKFISGEYSLISYLDGNQQMSVTFIYDKEYSRFRVYHHSYTSGF